MRIKNISTHPYEIPLSHGRICKGFLIHLTDHQKKDSWGEIAPLPQWSSETLEEALQQLNEKTEEITQIDWQAGSCLEQLRKMQLLPSLLFGLESALLSLLIPLSLYSICTSALLMGSPEEILSQAQLRYEEGYTSAKLKVSKLTEPQAFDLIYRLKDRFRLRIDVNRAWDTRQALRFFSHFSQDAFDYVEEPFQNPKELHLFSHPLAVDESFPKDLSLEELETFPTLKALVYKPAIQGGMTNALPLHAWATKRGIDLILGSSFESDMGLAHVASIAHRLHLTNPIGIGTYHFLTRYICATPLKFSRGMAHISGSIAHS